MQSRFEISFPLVLTGHKYFSITFALEKATQLVFEEGIYYLFGDNGSGKSTLLNMLALIAGTVGKKASPLAGGITFNGEAYSDKSFSDVRAADIREKHFSIFPQKSFFLPVSSRDNYLILNGSDPHRAEQFSSSQHPDFLSGGQQQQILMDILLDEKKPVWFLDEPLSNLDAARRRYFWETLERAYRKGLKTAFFIDHWMGPQIMNNADFEPIHTICVKMRYGHENLPADTDLRQISVYRNRCPQRFLEKQLTLASD